MCLCVTFRAVSEVVRVTGAINVGAADDRSQSGLMPANLITLAHFPVSAVMNSWHATGVMGIGTIPRSANRALSLGSARTALTSLLSIAVISAGGAFCAHQPRPGGG